MNKVLYIIVFINLMFFLKVSEHVNVFNSLILFLNSLNSELLVDYEFDSSIKVIIDENKVYQLSDSYLKKHSNSNYLLHLEKIDKCLKINIETLLVNKVHYLCIKENIGGLINEQ